MRSDTSLLQFNYPFMSLSFLKPKLHLFHLFIEKNMSLALDIFKQSEKKPVDNSQAVVKISLRESA